MFQLAQQRFALRSVIAEEAERAASYKSSDPADLSIGIFFRRLSPKSLLMAYYPFTTRLLLDHYLKLAMR